MNWPNLGRLVLAEIAWGALANALSLSPAIRFTVSAVIAVLMPPVMRRRS